MRDAYRAVLLALLTPLTLHLSRIQSPAPCALALGKRLSVQRYVFPAGFVCAPPTSGGTAFSYFGLSCRPRGCRQTQTLSFPTAFQEGAAFSYCRLQCCRPCREPPGIADTDRLCLFPQHSRETATFPPADCTLGPATEPWGWQMQAGFVLSRSPP